MNIECEDSCYIKLPALDRALAEDKRDEYFSRCDFQYKIEDDEVNNSICIWLLDDYEYVGSTEFNEFRFVEDMFNTFSRAVREDTGDSKFYFEPYDRIVFCGRACLSNLN